MDKQKKTGATKGVIIVAGVLVAFVAIAAFIMTRSNQKPMPAEVKGVSVPPPPQLQQDAKNGDVDKFKAIAAAVDKDRTTNAERSGVSSMPSPDLIELQSQLAAAGAQQNTQQQQANRQPQTVIAPPVSQQPTPEQQQLATNMAAAIEGLMAQSKPRVPLLTVFEGYKPTGTTQAVSQTAGQQGSMTEVASKRVIIKAGQLESASLDMPVNTDMPGPISATLIGGPFSGAKVIGKASRVGEYAKIEFTLMSIPGVEAALQVEAVALDGESLAGGVATDVDRKIPNKYLLKPMATAVAAIGQAIGQSKSTTTISINGNVTSGSPLTTRDQAAVGIGAAADQFKKDMDSRSDDPTVRVAKNTIIAIYFVKDVTQK